MAISSNPFEVGCSQPTSTPLRIFWSFLIGVAVAALLVLFERRVFGKHGIASNIIVCLGGVVAAATFFVYSEHIRPTCDMRDTFDFYTSLGAPKNVATQLTASQLHKTNAIYLYTVLMWVYLCARPDWRCKRD